MHSVLRPRMPAGRIYHVEAALPSEAMEFGLSAEEVVAGEASAGARAASGVGLEAVKLEIKKELEAIKGESCPLEAFIKFRDNVQANHAAFDATNNAKLLSMFCQSF